MEHKTTTTTKITFIDAAAKNWPIISFLAGIIFAIITMYFDIRIVKAQSIENKTDIRSLDSRVGNVEGDIKAIRQGIEYLINRK